VQQVSIESPEHISQVEMLSIEDFANRMGVGRTTIYDWLKSGSLRPGRHCIKIGGTIRFPWGTELLQKLLEDSAGNDDKTETQASNESKVKLLPKNPAKGKWVPQMKLDD
jgi:excisionase family DNA binding protein